MKKITLSVDDAVLAAARRYAAEHGSTVNRLVKEYLTALAAQEDRSMRARSELRELSTQSTFRLGKKTWSRQDLYQRKFFFDTRGLRGWGWPREFAPGPGAQTVYSEDLSDGQQYGGVRVINPFA